jgi:hypothetical protein
MNKKVKVTYNLERREYILLQHAKLPTIVCMHLTIHGKLVDTGAVV